MKVLGFAMTVVGGLMIWAGFKGQSVKELIKID